MSHESVGNPSVHDNAPSANPVPPGLEALVSLDKVFVRQDLELWEIYCGCEGNNSYNVTTENGRGIYKVKEESSFCSRCCCGKYRGFGAIIDDFEGHTTHINRNLACNTCFCPCCLNKLKVKSSSGELYGTVHQNWTLCKTKFTLKDAQNKSILKIKGPCCTHGCCCCDVDFNVYSVETGSKVGKVSKKWGGILREGFTDADNFGISFPVDLDVRMKMVLVSACILIDFMFFETSPGQPQGT